MITAGGEKRSNLFFCSLAVVSGSNTVSIIKYSIHLFARSCFHGAVLARVLPICVSVHVAYFPLVPSIFSWGIKLIRVGTQNT